VVNFVQAVRLRSIMDEVLKKIMGKPGSPGCLDDFLTANTKDTSNASAKSLLDVIRCCEAVHRMTYTALGDIPGRKTLEEGDSAKGSVALSILGALSQGVSTPDPDRAAVSVLPPESASTMPTE
jgi:hypothetical protein